jgi:hypothetical protein
MRKEVKRGDNKKSISIVRVGNSKWYSSSMEPFIFQKLERALSKFKRILKKKI